MIKKVPESLNYVIFIVLSLNNNRIEDPKIVEIFYQMESLRVLNLMGNPICGKVRYYRKTLTGMVFRFFSLNSGDSFMILVNHNEQVGRRT